MRLLHLSDLHLSRYGESGSWTQREKDDDGRWTALEVWQRWQIEGLRDKQGRPDKLRLVDPEGVVHRVKSWPSRKADKVISHLLAIAVERHRTSTERLVQHRPDAEELAAILHMDPRNTNLRALKLVDDVQALSPEIIVITGDITDNGFSYELVLHYLAPWIEAGRLFTVPGNHDTYDMFPRLGRTARTAAKTHGYQEFAESIGLAPNAVGSYVRRGEDVAVVGINSCKMPRAPLSASGAVSHEQLVWLSQLGHDVAFSDARLRIGLVHHHLLRMPFLVGKRSPLEVGMRMRNSAEVMTVCTDARLSMLLHGHRHHGYVVQLADRPTVISSPSSTLGCKSSGRILAWLIDLSLRHPFPVMHSLNGKP